jgi:cyclase
LVNLVREVQNTINIPFTVGGGISLYGDVEVLVRLRFDQFISDKNPLIILASKFGSQCVVGD